MLEEMKTFIELAEALKALKRVEEKNVLLSSEECFMMVDIYKSIDQIKKNHNTVK